MEAGPEGIDRLLGELHDVVAAKSPHLARLLEIFGQEARFGRGWLEASLSALSRGDAVLEIGAGLMILSCQLVREGFSVTALEPISEGFSDFTELQAIVLEHAAAQGVVPRIVRLPVEEFHERAAFALAYSVNVMEHVRDFPEALKNAGEAIRPGAHYRFICPNYLFPYEPHFDIPTLFSKKLTERVFRSRIAANRRVADPEGLWRSLNWVTVPQVLHAAGRMSGFSVQLERTMFRIALERALHDKEFSARRAAWVRFLARGIVALRLHRLAEWIPVQAHPIIDCTLTRLRPT